MYDNDKFPYPLRLSFSLLLFLSSSFSYFLSDGFPFKHWCVHGFYTFLLLLCTCKKNNLQHDYDGNVCNNSSLFIYTFAAKTKNNIFFLFFYRLIVFVYAYNLTVACNVRTICLVSSVVLTILKTLITSKSLTPCYTHSRF